MELFATDSRHNNEDLVSSVLRLARLWVPARAVALFDFASGNARLAWADLIDQGTLWDAELLASRPPLGLREGAAFRGRGHGGRSFLVLPCRPHEGGVLRGLLVGAVVTVVSLFFTHLHSDHVVDYNNLLLQGWTAGLGRRQPLEVLGPGPRGELPPVFQVPGRPAKEPPAVFPEAPTPGTVQMTDGIFRAFATDLNDRIRDYLWPDLRGLVQVRDIALPAIPGFVSPNLTPAPDMAPFEVWSDANVRVTATLVAHAPVFPSFAFRFDSEEGSVVFSGDTAPCDNLVRLARDADVLVHEVIDAAWVDRLFPPPLDAATDALKHHLLSAHTSIEDAGRVAERAGAKTLVLSHVIPHNLGDDRLNLAGRHYSGRVVPGHDLDTIGVGRRRAA